MGAHKRRPLPPRGDQSPKAAVPSPVAAPAPRSKEASPSRSPSPASRSPSPGPPLKSTVAEKQQPKKEDKEDLVSQFQSGFTRGLKKRRKGGNNSVDPHELDSFESR